MNSETLTMNGRFVVDFTTKEELARKVEELESALTAMFVAHGDTVIDLNGIDVTRFRFSANMTGGVFTIQSTDKEE